MRQIVKPLIAIGLLLGAPGLTGVALSRTPLEHPTKHRLHGSTRTHTAIRNTVRNIIAHPIESQRVVLEGRIVLRVGSNRFLLADDTGKISLAIAGDVLSHTTFDVNDIVWLEGNVRLRPEKPPEITVGTLRRKS